MSYVRTKKIVRSGLSGYVRTGSRGGYVQIGLGAGDDCLKILSSLVNKDYNQGTTVLKNPGTKLTPTQLDCVINSDYGMAHQFVVEGNPAKLVNTQILAFLKSLNPADLLPVIGAIQQWLTKEKPAQQEKLRPVISNLVQTFSAQIPTRSVPRQSITSYLPGPKTTIQVSTVPTADQSAATAAARASAVRIVDHTGGQDLYVRDNTPAGIQAQQEGRLVTTESGGSGILTPPPPPPSADAQAQPVLTPPSSSGGLLSGYMPWLLAGGGLLALLLLTQKKKPGSPPTP